MDDVTRHVGIGFLVLGALIAWVLVKTCAMFLAMVGPGTDMILFADIHLSAILGVALAGGGAFWAWKNETTYTHATEVAVELRKVTWPTWEESKKSTWIVILFSVVVALFIAVADFLWKTLTDIMLSA